jgi:hypothetical protein
MPQIRLQHNSMQFSNTRAQHAKDAVAVFKKAKSSGAMFVTGTEAGSGKKNGLRDELIKAAKTYGFTFNGHSSGDWVACNNALATVVATGYDGPFIKGTTGLKAAQGAHAARGIPWITAKAKDSTIGTVSVGSVHYLTVRSTKVSGSNKPLAQGIERWGKAKGKGNQLAFIAGDFNMNDQKRDVFLGVASFATVWDDLKKWPGTHGSKAKGPTIDAIARYKPDSRVKTRSAAAFDDAQLQLATDHFLIQAVFDVKPLSSPKK